MITEGIVPKELYYQAVDVFLAGFGSKYTGVFCSEEDKRDFVEIFMQDREIIYYIEDGKFLGFLCYSTPDSLDPLNPIDILRRFGLYKFLLISYMSMFSSFRPPSSSAYIEALAVAPDSRAKGIGTELMSYFIRKAAAQKIDVLYLKVVGSSLRAKKLYERLGFKDDKRVNHRFAAWLFDWDFKWMDLMKLDL